MSLTWPLNHFTLLCFCFGSISIYTLKHCQFCNTLLNRSPIKFRIDPATFHTSSINSSDPGSPVIAHAFTITLLHLIRQKMWCALDHELFLASSSKPFSSHWSGSSIFRQSQADLSKEFFWELCRFFCFSFIYFSILLDWNQWFSPHSKPSVVIFMDAFHASRLWQWYAQSLKSSLDLIRFWAFCGEQTFWTLTPHLYKVLWVHKTCLISQLTQALFFLHLSANLMFTRQWTNQRATFAQGYFSMQTVAAWDRTPKLLINEGKPVLNS